MMSQNKDNKTRIDEYIKAHPEYTLEPVFPINLKGEKRLLKVYKLPIDSFIF